LHHPQRTTTSSLSYHHHYHSQASSLCFEQKLHLSGNNFRFRFAKKKWFLFRFFISFQFLMGFWINHCWIFFFFCSMGFVLFHGDDVGRWRCLCSLNASSSSSQQQTHIHRFVIHETETTTNRGCEYLFVPIPSFLYSPSCLGFFNFGKKKLKFVTQISDFI
jgi:hypothetical protein